MPLHSGKGRTVAETLGRVMNYVENPEKTNGGDLVTAYQCNPSIADQEFLFSKRQYAAMKVAGVEVKRGKHLAFKVPNGKRFIRCDSLCDDYTEAKIMERISGKRIVTPKANAVLQFSRFEKAAIYAIAETGVCHLVYREEKTVSRV